MTALFEAPIQTPTAKTNLATEQPELRLRHILKTLPRECFDRSPWRAATSALVSLVMAGIGYGMILLAPWYFLPLAWFFAGTALTGWFVIAHDCGHRSFARRRWVNDLIGHVFMLPLLYPFHSWRILHNFHHKHTNKLDVDNAWRPFRPDFYDSMSGFERWGYRRLRGWFWWLASIIHWADLHFDWRKFTGKDREQVRLSVLVTLGAALVLFPGLLLTTGIWGVVKFWLMPWLVYHFWMSTFTLVHHTAPNIQFTPAETWREAAAQLTGTVHCDYPRWIEFLCHDINVHIPHHISTAIPSYNLRLAHASLKENWGPYLQETQFSLALMQQIVDQCHLYHSEQAYESFHDYRARTGQA